METKTDTIDNIKDVVHPQTTPTPVAPTAHGEHKKHVVNRNVLHSGEWHNAGSEIKTSHKHFKELKELGFID